MTTKTDCDHATAENVPGITEGLDEAQLDLVTSYLSHYTPDECPGCGSGRFSWGLAWGAGHCTCGWPGRLYHVITDTREQDDLVCVATCNGHRVCTATRGEHRPVTRTWHTMDGPNKGQRTERVHLMCPEPQAPPGLRREGFDSEYRPPTIAEFKGVLWAHPDYVSEREEEDL